MQPTSFRQHKVFPKDKDDYSDTKPVSWLLRENLPRASQGQDGGSIGEVLFVEPSLSSFGIFFGSLSLRSSLLFSPACKRTTYSLVSRSLIVEGAVKRVPEIPFTFLTWSLLLFKNNEAFLPSLQGELRISLVCEHCV